MRFVQKHLSIFTFFNPIDDSKHCIFENIQRIFHGRTISTTSPPHTAAINTSIRQEHHQAPPEYPGQPAAATHKDHLHTTRIATYSHEQLHHHQHHYHHQQQHLNISTSPSAKSTSGAPAPTSSTPTGPLPHSSTFP